MRATSAVLAVAAATGAMAQLPSNVTTLLGSLSSQCQQTVLGLAVNSNFSQCLHLTQLVPIVTSAISSNTSLIPAFDQFTSIECGQPGCSNSTLTAAMSQIGAGCATDLKQYNITNGTLNTIAANYPLAREVVCLKTSKPYNSTALPAPIPIANPPYNITNGTTYCTTSLMTELSAKVGQNLSIPFFYDLYKSYENNTIQQYATKFNVTDICNDCIFGAADLIGAVYPVIGNATLSSIGIKNYTVSGINISNVTLASALNSTCAAYNYSLTFNGTLPNTIRLSAVNSTFSYNITAGNTTTRGANNTSPIRRNVAAVKARWIGA